MKARSFVILGTAALLAFATGVAWRYARLTRQTEAALDALTANRGRLTAELQRWKDRTAAPKASPAPSRPPAAAAGPGSVAATPGHSQQWEKDSKAQLFQLAVTRVQEARRYGILFQKLGLTAEQIAKFEDNLANRDEQLIDLNAVLRSMRGSTAPVPPETQDAVTEFRANANADYQAAQQDLLGSAGYAQLHEYERMLPVQETAGSLAGSAILVGVPFTAQQAQQLTQVLAQASSDYQKGGIASPDNVNWDAVDLQAQSFLSASQMNVLRNMGAPTEGQLWSQFHRALVQAREADAGNASP